MKDQFGVADKGLVDFIVQSNYIEGIMGRVTQTMIRAHEDLIEAEALTIPILESFVAAIQPGAVLRREPWQNVRVGSHLPPQGGPEIEKTLTDILERAPYAEPYYTHLKYETLHPFTDGNGRSGRAIWLWQMRKLGRDPFSLLFLHRWYYQSLQGGRQG